MEKLGVDWLLLEGLNFWDLLISGHKCLMLLSGVTTSRGLFFSKVYGTVVALA